MEALLEALTDLADLAVAEEAKADDHHRPESALPTPISKVVIVASPW